MSHEKNMGEMPEESQGDIKSLQDYIFWGALTYTDKDGKVVDLSDQDVVDLKDLGDEHKER